MKQTPKYYYTKREVAEEYDGVRFASAGGRVIDSIQENAVLSLLLGDSGRLLDLGTGTGRFALQLASRGQDVIGLDSSAEMIGIAISKRERLGLKLNPQFIRGDILFPPFKEMSFDGIICIHVLMHLPEWQRAVGNIAKLLVHGGVAVLEFPNKYSFSCIGKVLRRLARMLKIHAQWTETEPNLFRNADIICAFEASGLTVTHTEMKFFLPETIYREAPRLIVPLIWRLDKVCLCSPLRNFASTIIMKGARTRY